MLNCNFFKLNEHPNLMTGVEEVTLQRNFSRYLPNDLSRLNLVARSALKNVEQLNL